VCVQVREPRALFSVDLKKTFSGCKAVVALGSSPHMRPASLLAAVAHRPPTRGEDLHDVFRMDLCDASGESLLVSSTTAETAGAASLRPKRQFAVPWSSGLCVCCA
jgi:hypothetical protein